MYRTIFIFLLLFSTLCRAQDNCKFNNAKFKIVIQEFSVFGIAHETDISAPSEILPKFNATMSNLGMGVGFKTRIARNEYLKAEFSLIQKGCHYNFPNNFTETIRLNYIEIPLLWSHRFYRRKKYFYFETGIAFSTLLLSSRSIAVYAETSQIPNAQNFKRFDFPWIASIKAPLNSKGKNNLSIGFRFSYSPFSIHNTFKTNSIWMYRDDGMHHLTYGIQIDYIFRR